MGEGGGANVVTNGSGPANQNLAGWNNPTHSLGGGLAQVEDVNLLEMFSDWM